MTKTLDEFYNDLGARESGGNYSSINKYGYIGKYQMGEAAMIDAGYYKKASGRYNNDWTGQFTGKDGVYSIEDFLKNKQAQENAQKAFKQVQWEQLKAIGADKYIGKEINGVKVTQSGLLAAAHLKGPGAVKEYLQSDGKNIPRDAFGTSVENYMKKFEGYDVSNVTGIKNDCQEDQTSLYGYANPLTGSNHIYTREEVGSMSKEEFAKHEKEIDAQIRVFKGTMPTNKDLELEAKTGGGVVYVNSYTRTDGTEVKGYYRSKPKI
ncbi:hypothetical protein IKU74_06795 [bacterium]|nr:hypothetical protein [bacterium]